MPKSDTVRPPIIRVVRNSALAEKQRAVIAAAIAYHAQQQAKLGAK